MAAPLTPTTPNEPRPALPGPFYVDTHAHVLPMFDQPRLLDAAAGYAERHGGGVSVLCLAERRDDHVFSAWRETGEVGAWSFESVGEPEVLFAHRGGPTEVVVIAGRQIITAERLEVLALGTDQTFTDGCDTAATLAEVRSSGALAVIPYGFCKWTGRRGRLLSRLIEQHHDRGLILGDNGGRPTLGPRPPHFDQAAAHRMTILPGTDPLPLRSCARQAGGFGVIVDGPMPQEAFGRELRGRLATLGPVPHRFGDHLSLPRALFQQAALRLTGSTQKR